MSTVSSTNDDRLDVHLDTQHLRCSIGAAATSVPVGLATIRQIVVSDPPDPIELTNAIGLVVDHLDDVERALPGIGAVSLVTLSGLGACVVADLEVGGAAPLPYRLGRLEAEEVFRTVATEAAVDRALNPGLPSEWVHDIVATCCVVVALIRHLGLDAIELHDAATTPPARGHGT